MDSNELDQQTLEHLDSVAQIVASLLSDTKDVEDIDDNKKALLMLGKAYLIVYNLLLTEYMSKTQLKEKEEEQKENEGAVSG